MPLVGKPHGGATMFCHTIIEYRSLGSLFYDGSGKGHSLTSAFLVLECIDFDVNFSLLDVVVVVCIAFQWIALVWL